MAPAKKKRMGRPATGRKVRLQILFEPDEVAAITKLAKAQNKSVSVVGRELAVAQLARSKKQPLAVILPCR